MYNVHPKPDVSGRGSPESVTTEQTILVRNRSRSPGIGQVLELGCAADEVTPAEGGGDAIGQ